MCMARNEVVYQCVVTANRYRIDHHLSTYISLYYCTKNDKQTTCKLGNHTTKARTDVTWQHYVPWWCDYLVCRFAYRPLYNNIN